MAKIRDLTLLSDIFPTGYHGAFTAGVGPGSTVYVAGAGPVGLACARTRPAAGRGGRHRRRHDPRAPGAGEELRLRSRSTSARTRRSATRSSRSSACPRSTAPSTASASRRAATARTPATRRRRRCSTRSWTITRAGGALGIPGLYVTGDPGGVDDERQDRASLGIRIGLGWAKSHSFTTGQCPVMQYNRGLMQAILHDKVQIAKAVNATVISLDEAPQGLQGLRQGRGQEVRHRPARAGQALRGARVSDLAAVRPRGRRARRGPTSSRSPGPAAWPAGRAARPRGRRRAPSRRRSASICVDPCGPLKTISMRPSAGRTVARG